MCNETKTLIHCCWECKLVQPLWKAVWRLLKKLKIELPDDPVILLLGIYPKEHKSGKNRDTCIQMFITALFTGAKLWKQPRFLMNGSRKYEFLEFYSAIRKNSSMWFEGKWIPLEDIMLSEGS
jgi:hypothetical protein